MSNPKRRIAVIDASASDFLLLCEYLNLEVPGRYGCLHFPDFATFTAKLATMATAPDIVLLDCELPDGSGLENLRHALEMLPLTPVIGMSEQMLSSVEHEALDLGASHFLAKDDLTPRRLAHIIAVADAGERRVRNLVERAHFDSLTGLANRNVLKDRIGHALERCQRSKESVALLLIDLDDFKRVNDSFGHDVGDAYLREISKSLRGAVRESDTVARLGGDEFAILLEGLRHSEQAIQIAVKLLDLTNTPMKLGDFSVQPGMSIGISLFQPESSRFSAEWLQKAADVALYRAKETGKNRYFVYTDEMDQQIVRNLDLDRAIRQALQKKELVLHYQPIVSPGSFNIVAFEALLRWQHPQRGLIGPAEFLPALEKLGFMYQVGNFVLREGLRQFGRWQSILDESIVLHINVSAAQLSHSGFADMVRAELEAAGVRPGRLVLELTETVLFEGTPRLQNEFAELEGIGVRFVIDDFGTGYGSYDYLKHFPIHGIKIDKHFVDAIGHNQIDCAIVRSIIGLASELNFDVTAEGIETPQQLKKLCELGRPNMQGFLFHRPQSAMAVEQLASERWPARSAIGLAASGVEAAG
ncbi:MAG: EAL domain-containing protein [Gammaproteobacteria bacterium]|nr:EAL domain-containing protein [Gammaproteobacteria bacterium]